MFRLLTLSRDEGQDQNDSIAEAARATCRLLFNRRLRALHLPRIHVPGIDHATIPVSRSGYRGSDLSDAAAMHRGRSDEQPLAAAYFASILPIAETSPSMRSPRAS